MIKQEQIVADLASDATYTLNVFESGAMKKAREASVAGFLAGQKSRSEPLKLNERVYIRDIKVRDTDVDVFVTTVESYETNFRGNTSRSPLKALVQLKFDPGYLDSAPAKDVEKVIEQVFMPEALANAPKSIQLGESIAEVESAFGKPERSLPWVRRKFTRIRMLRLFSETER